MTDDDLITYCAKHCQTPKALFAAWRVNRMIDLAGSPKAYPPVLDGSFHTMHEEMQTLVDLARTRLARPKTGIEIKVGHAYRDQDGEVRFVILIETLRRGKWVTWDSVRIIGNIYKELKSQARKDRPHGYMRMDQFQKWAIEEVIL